MRGGIIKQKLKQQVMSERHRNDSKYSQNFRSSQYPRQGSRDAHYNSSYRSSHYNPPRYDSSYKQENSLRPYHKDSQYSQHFSKPHQGENIQNEKYHSGSYRQFPSNNEYHERQSSYSKYPNSNKQPSQYRQKYQSSRQEYSNKDSRRDYDRKSDQDNRSSKYEKDYERRQRSRSRSRNKEYRHQSKDYKHQSYPAKPYQGSYRQSHYSQAKTDYAKKTYHNQEQSRDKNKNYPTFDQKDKKQSPHTIGIEFNKEQKSPAKQQSLFRDNRSQRTETEIKISGQVNQQSYDKYASKEINYPKNRENTQKQSYPLNQTRRQPELSKNPISIEVKSRHRSPKQKLKKHRKATSSQSGSRSKSKGKRQKSVSKRRHRKHQSSHSSSSSSSNSSSSSSSSSSNSSSSSSSRSSSSSDSHSVQSRKMKYASKEHKQFYPKNPYPKNSSHYSSSYNYQRERPMETSTHDRPYHNSTTELSSKNVINDKKNQPTQAKDQTQKYKTYEQPKVNYEKSYKDQLPYYNDKEKYQKKDQNHQNKDEEKTIIPTQKEEKEFQKGNVTAINAQGTFNQHPSDLNKAFDTYTDQTIFPRKSYQQRDFYRKPYNPNYQNRQTYQTNRPSYGQYYNYNNQSQAEFKPLNPPVPQAFYNASNQGSSFLYPTFQNPPYSRDQNRVDFGLPNLQQVKSQGNQLQRKPYINTYQNYPPPLTSTSQFNQTLPSHPYQRFNQGYISNKPYQRNFYANKNSENQQQGEQLNYNSNQGQFFNPNQSQIPYQPAYQPYFRRVASQSVGQRKYPYYQQFGENQQSTTQFQKLQTEKEDLALLQQAFKRETDLKKIKELIPCSKTLQLIQKARQNLTIPSIKTSFLILDVFKDMSNFKKQTMNSNLKSILQDDLDKKFNEEKSKVLENLRLLKLDESEKVETEQTKQRAKKDEQNNDSKKIESKQNLQSMEAQQQINPEKEKKLKQYIWKKPEMSQNLRLLRSNLEMMKKASSSLSQICRKTKMRCDAN